jgi:hypothetical protein
MGWDLYAVVAEPSDRAEGSVYPALVFVAFLLRSGERCVYIGRRVFPSDRDVHRLAGTVRSGARRATASTRRVSRLKTRKVSSTQAMTESAGAAITVAARMMSVRPVDGRMPTWQRDRLAGIRTS